MGFILVTRFSGKLISEKISDLNIILTALVAGTVVVETALVLKQSCGGIDAAVDDAPSCRADRVRGLVVLARLIMK